MAKRKTQRSTHLFRKAEPKRKLVVAASRKVGSHPYNLFIIAVALAGILYGTHLGDIGVFSKIPTQPEEYLSLNEPGSAQIYLPAVDEQNNGIVTVLIVEVKPGTGKILTDIDKLIFWADTQQSIQTAKSVAGEISKVNTSTVDITYSILVDQASVVGGPSAGAALTIATIAALQNKTLKEDVMITGTIETDGTVGQVGSIIEKASAAKAVGANLFLVPKGEGEKVYTKPVQECNNQFGVLFCSIVYQRTVVNVGESIGIEVKEVADAEEALEYFLQ